MAGANVSPWVWEAFDYAGSVIRATTNFNNQTGALSGMTVFRDAACLYKRVYWDRGADGSPDTTTKVFDVPVGTSSITKQQLSNNGFDTITQLMAVQVTAGPLWGQLIYR